MKTVPWKDVVAVQPVGGCRLRLCFADGAAGVVDVATLVQFSGVFAPLQDPATFAQVRVDPESGTICWPNGADLAPETLYAAVAGAEQTPPVAAAS